MGHKNRKACGRSQGKRERRGKGGKEEGTTRRAGGESRLLVFFGFWFANRWVFFYHAHYKIFRDYWMFCFFCCYSDIMGCISFLFFFLFLLLVVVWNRFAASPPAWVHRGVIKHGYLGSSLCFLSHALFFLVAFPCFPYVFLDAYYHNPSSYPLSIPIYLSDHYTRFRPPCMNSSC